MRDFLLASDYGEALTMAAKTMQLMHGTCCISIAGIYSAKSGIFAPNRVPAMQRRQHLRVRLRLPARLRWSAPLGQRTDRCETINVSRGGLLLACNEAHGAGHPLWVTFPFDPDDSGAQPETLARVVRCAPSPDQNEGPSPGRSPSRLPAPWIVAMHFEGAAHSQSRRNGGVEATRSQNGGGSKIALAIRVRPEHIPWYEEAMTIEVSPDKLKFVTNREYTFGQRLLVSFVSGSELPWAGDVEWTTKVTGIEMEAGSNLLCVTVRKKSS